MWYQSSHPWQVNQEDRDVLQVPGGLQVPWDRHSPDLLSFPAAQTKPDDSSEAIFTILKKVLNFSFDGCDGTTGKLTCLPLFPGRPVGPLFPAVPGSPFGPISPCTKKYQPNGQQGWIWKRSKYLKWESSFFAT